MLQIVFTKDLNSEQILFISRKYTILHFFVSKEYTFPLHTIHIIQRTTKTTLYYGIRVYHSIP